jgi:hypothetical protein
MAHGNTSMNVHINVILRRFRVNLAAVEKQSVLHILSVSVALLTQHAMRMRHIILSSFACLALPYFSTLSDNRHDFREKKVIEHTTCDFTFCTTFTHQFHGTHPVVCNSSHRYSQHFNVPFETLRVLMEDIRRSCTDL